MTIRAHGDRAKRLLAAQGCRCFLMITEECVARGGVMTALHPRKALRRMTKTERRAILKAERADRSRMTIEHVWPAKAKKRPDHVPVGLIAVACFACNNAKGGRVPTDDQLARAIEINRPWIDRRRQEEERAAANLVARSIAA